jgi:hypothetical protein
VDPKRYQAQKAGPQYFSLPGCLFTHSLVHYSPFITQIIYTVIFAFGTGNVWYDEHGVRKDLQMLPGTAFK